jgi:hypothetical protein
LKVEGATSAPLPEINPNYPFYRIGISSPELPPRIIHKFAQATGQ